MTAPSPGRPDAYPHAADLALIPFADGAAVMLMEAATPRDVEWRREVARAAAEGEHA